MTTQWQANEQIYYSLPIDFLIWKGIPSDTWNYLLEIEIELGNINKKFQMPIWDQDAVILFQLDVGEMILVEITIDNGKLIPRDELDK